MDDQKQQIVERLLQANNILVTVSANPSVDQLSAAIGLTLVLNKMGKHGTTVFSGEVPSVIEFLQPEKTIEKNTDSLQDFIIALDKSKADKLRYKVEDSHVKIFITPYRTSITDKDLVFSQGDFNVEVVVALGVLDPKDLDQAITAHGRILHDATVISVSTQTGGNLGSINWSNAQSSSLCEMVAGMADSLGTKLIDDQMATAFLTGIVAETERFSNAKTSAITMGVSAKLMAAGANQQLIATKLEKPAPPPPEPTPPTPAPPPSQEQEQEPEPVPTDKKEEPQTEDPLDKLVEELNETEKDKKKTELMPAPPPPVALAAGELKATKPAELRPVEAVSPPELQPEPQPKPAPAPPKPTPEPQPELPKPEEAVVSPDGSLQITHNESIPEESSDDEEPEVDQIRIDEQGIIKKTNDVETELKAAPIPAISTGSKLVLEPPILGGTLTANAHVPGLGGTNDPMSMPQTEKPLLSHDTPASTTIEPVIELPMPTLPPMPALMPITTPAPIIYAPSPKQASSTGVPLDDPVIPQQSLADLEQTVKLSEKSAPTQTDIGSARDAIMDAIDSTHEPRLEPIAALNSQQLGPDLSHTEPENKATPIISVAEQQEDVPGPALVMPELPVSAASTVNKPPVADPTAPPPVPPPMMPPLQ